MTGRGGLADGAELARDLGMDSLMRLELQFWIEQEFAHPVSDPESLRTVGDVLLAACGRAVDPGGRPAEAGALRVVRRGPGWRSQVPEGATLTEVFLAQAARGPGRVALADQTGGVRTYRDLITAILALRPALQAIEGPYVGIMLPASAGAAALYLAVAFAGKIPVMVNWSTGIKNMVHGLDLLGVARVLTSEKVVARIQSQGMDLAPLGDRLLPLERVGASLSGAAKLGALLKARTVLARSCAARCPDRRGPVHQRQREPAQGGAAHPRQHPGQHARPGGGVPASCPRTGSWACCRPSTPSALTCTMVLPLCSGMKAVYYPVPTDGGVLARHIESLRGHPAGGHAHLPGRHRPGRQGCGAAHPALRHHRRREVPGRPVRHRRPRWPGMRILEGYGITECSPVVSGNREGRAVRGSMGVPLPSLATAVVDLEERARVPRGAIGMLLLRGPSVFGGYLGSDGPAVRGLRGGILVPHRRPGAGGSGGQPGICRAA